MKPPPRPPKQEITEDIRRALRLAQKFDSLSAYQALAFALRNGGFGWYAEEIDAAKKADAEDDGT
jgi:hypothetical protein